jgi:Right handed beta helix region
MILFKQNKLLLSLILGVMITGCSSSPGPSSAASSSSTGTSETSSSTASSSGVGGATSSTASSSNGGPVDPSPILGNGETAITPVDFEIENANAAGVQSVPDCTPVASGHRYDVVDQASMNAIPWNLLKPGDVVCVAYNPLPYKSKIYFITRGAPGAPISLVGLRGPRGERPVIDGSGAVTSPLINPAPNDTKIEIGVISLIAQFVSPPNSPWGWHPGWINISGLKVMHANPGYFFTDNLGVSHTYSFSAGIYVLGSDHVKIEDCELTDNALGIFANSLENTPGLADRATSNLTIRNNYVHGNGGNPLGIHEIYIEGRGCNVIGNWVESSNINHGVLFKSRCGHERIQANMFIGGTPNQALLHLVDPQSGWTTIGVASDFSPSVVNGNVFIDKRGGMGPQIIFGGDSYNEPDHYKTKLIAYSNTFVSFGESAGAHTPIFGLHWLTPTDPGVSVWATNNLIDRLPTSKVIVSLATGQGTLFANSNWINAAINPHDIYDQSVGIVKVTNPIPGLTSGFVFPAKNWHLLSTSALVNTGVDKTAIPSTSGINTVTDMGEYEFSGTQIYPGYKARLIKNKIDVGAFEVP